MRPTPVDSFVPAVLLAATALGAPPAHAERSSKLESGPPASTSQEAARPRAQLALLATPPGSERWRAHVQASQGAPLDSVLAVRVLPDDTTLVVGATMGLLGFVRFDASGQRVSSVSIPTTPGSVSHAVVDTSGDVTLLTSSERAELARYDGLDGTLVWRQTLTSSLWQTFGPGTPRLILDPAGDIFVSFMETLGTWFVEKRDRTTGARLWGTGALETSGAPHMAASATGDLLVLHDTRDAHPSLSRYASSNGQLAWHVDLPAGIASSLAVAATGRGFAAIDPGFGMSGDPVIVSVGADGTVLWTFSSTVSGGTPPRLAADDGGNVTVQRSVVNGSELVHLSGANGALLWGPVSTLQAAWFGHDPQGNVYLGDGTDLAAYSAKSGAQLWTQPVPANYFSASSIGEHGGRLAIAARFTPTPQLHLLAAATGQPDFVQQLITAEGIAQPTAVSTDPQGNILLVATASRGSTLGTSVVKYDGRSGTPIWGPLELPQEEGDLVLSMRHGDFVTYSSNVLPPVVSRYAGHDGSLRWGGPLPMYERIGWLAETPDQGLAIVTTSESGQQRVSKLDGQTGAVIWSVGLEGPPSFFFGRSNRLDSAGNVVSCYNDPSGRGTAEKLDGATGQLLWRRPVVGNIGTVCEVDRVGDVFVLGTSYAVNGQSPRAALLVERLNGENGERRWHRSLPPANPGRAYLVPDNAGGALVVRAYEDAGLLRLGPDGRTLWGPLASLAPLALWPNGDTLAALRTPLAAECSYHVARLSAQTGGFVWGPVAAGDCSSSIAALDGRGNVTFSARRDGAWHVGLLQGETGIGIYDQALDADAWPLTFDGFAFLGTDVVVAAIKGLEGLTVRIGPRRRGE